MVGEETAFCDDCGAEYDVEIEDGDVRLYPEGEDKPVMKLRQQEALERLRRFANKE